MTAAPKLARAWLQQVQSDPAGSEDIRKVAAAITQCCTPCDDYFVIGGDGVFADELLLQLTDDVTELRAVGLAIRWLNDRGYLDVLTYECGRASSFIICALVALPPPSIVDARAAP
jgi:hypothetical protein